MLFKKCLQESKPAEKDMLAACIQLSIFTETHCMRHLVFYVSCFLIVAVNLYGQQAFPPFLYGVASGDPLHDRVILWTHVSPSDSAQPAIVNWRIATDMAFSNIVSSGSLTTDSSRGFTVKVDATGLLPGTTYYYDFETGGGHSAVGRTKTAPSGSITNARFAVATCAKYSKGYFNAYARIGGRDDIDAVVHLGDYIYESRDSGAVGRVMLPYARCSTLVQFRTRYAQYHSDPDLTYARQRHPFINVWDDHETGNDSWPHGSEHFPDSAQFDALKQDAIKAYFEWIPIRENPSYPQRIYRTFQYGDLIDLIMIDTRMEGRMKQLPFEPANMPAIYDSSRTLLGHEQFNWLISHLDNSTARWRIIGQQVMMAPALFYGSPINEDQWDNYPAERAKLYKHLEDHQMDNVVVLTGDVHAALANNLPIDTASYDDATGTGSVAVEFITPAIASSKSDFSLLSFATIKIHDPHIQYVEFDRNGYMVLDVSSDKVQGDYYFVPTTDVPDPNEELSTRFYTLHGSKRLLRDSVLTSAKGLTSEEKLIRLYPNPAEDNLTVHIYNTVGKVTLKIYNLEGKTMKVKAVDIPQPGDFQFNLDISELDEGIYFLKAYSERKEFYNGKFSVAE